MLIYLIHDMYVALAFTCCIVHLHVHSLVHIKMCMVVLVFVVSHAIFIYDRPIGQAC